MLGVNILGCVSTSVGSGRHTWDVKLGWAVTWGKVRIFTCVASLFTANVSINASVYLLLFWIFSCLRLFLPLDSPGFLC